MFRPVIPILALIPALACAVSPAAAQYFPDDDALGLMIRYIVEDGEAPAVALALVEPDGSTRSLAHGDGGDGARPLGPGSAFELGEVTMTFTATLLADMAARGELSVDDPVAEYLPDSVRVPSMSGYEMTIEHLATHRSGLPAEPPDAYGDFTLDDLYAFLGSYELDSVPGRDHEFSVLGYGLLGHVLSRAARMPFEALLRERVLEPLGMDRTGYATDGEAAEWMVRGHADGDVVAFTTVMEALQGGTGLRSTADDMAAFLAANAGAPEAPLEAAMRVTHEVRTPYDPEGEGYGWSWRTYAAGRQRLLVTHGGRTPGFTALLSVDPARGIGTVLLASAGDFNDWAARDLLYFRGPPPGETVEADPELLARYVGAYGPRGGRYRASPNRGSIFIRLEEGGRLSYQPDGRIRTPLFPMSDSTFYMVRAPLTVAFDRFGDDVEMTVTTDGRQPAGEGRTWRSWRIDTETPSPQVAAGNASPWSAWRAGRWILVGALGVAALVFILRPVWSRPRART